jgi:nicotinamidase/pyrazinamidase
MTTSEPDFMAGDALLLVDVQNDFLLGGSLAVPDANAVIPVLNAWLAVASKRSVPIYASRDWHPPGHASFREQGGDWPPHCVQDTPGAAFAPDLALPPITEIVTKGTSVDHDAYSAFQETGLADRLREAGVGRLWIGGVALDVCVRATCLDAREHGFQVGLIVKGTRPTEAGRGREALAELEDAGVTLA